MLKSSGYQVDTINITMKHEFTAHRRHSGKRFCAFRNPVESSIDWIADNGFAVSGMTFIG